MSDDRGQERWREIWERHEAGETYAAMAREMGITPGRVRQMAKAWERNRRLIAKRGSEQVRQYSHRNGETEPPTIDGAYFWFQSIYWDFELPIEERNRHDSSFGMFFVIDDEAYTATGEILPLAKLQGRWWGPADSPWRYDA